MKIQGKIKYKKTIMTNVFKTHDLQQKLNNKFNEEFDV